MRAIASPEGASSANCFGNAVARMTTMAVTAGRIPPGIPKYFVRKLPSEQMAKDTARAVAVCSTGSLLLDDSDSVVPIPSVKVSRWFY